MNLLAENISIVTVLSTSLQPVKKLHELLELQFSK